MAEPINSITQLKVGDYFEDCSFHPCLCIEVDEAYSNVDGLSLINGHIKSCSAIHCGLRKLTLEEAITWKKHGPKGVNVPIDKPWW